MWRTIQSKFAPFSWTLSIADPQCGAGHLEGDLHAAGRIPHAGSQYPDRRSQKDREGKLSILFTAMLNAWFQDMFSNFQSHCIAIHSFSSSNLLLGFVQIVINTYFKSPIYPTAKEGFYRVDTVEWSPVLPTEPQALKLFHMYLK